MWRRRSNTTDDGSGGSGRRVVLVRRRWCMYNAVKWGHRETDELGRKSTGDGGGNCGRRRRWRSHRQHGPVSHDWARRSGRPQRGLGRCGDTGGQHHTRPHHLWWWWWAREAGRRGRTYRHHLGWWVGASAQSRASSVTAARSCCPRLSGFSSLLLGGSGISFTASGALLVGWEKRRSMGSRKGTRGSGGAH